MKNILLVEDDRATARAVTARLKFEGYSVCAVHTAWEAINAARLQPYDLFVLDVGLPDGDGLSLAGQLLVLPGAHATPVLFLTGASGLEARLRASKLGICAWLDKPYRADDLRQAVAMTLQDRRPTRPQRHEFSPLRTLFRENGPPRPSKVLVLEDDKRLATALHRRLEHAGYDVAVAHSGSAGLAAAVHAPPALILSDIYMPGGLGFTLFEHLAVHGLGGTPVIFLTASRRPHLKETALKMGAADFFEKPADPSALLRSIRRAICARN